MSAGRFIALDALLAAGVCFDLVRSFRTGKVRLRWGGTATREKQPQRFWRYVYSSYAVLGFCALGFLWALISPESL